LDDVPPGQVPRFQEELREHLRTEGSVYKDIREGKELPDELADRLKAEIDKFKGNFAVREESAVPGT
ncbi:MAG TPA: hypothetical protein VK896_05640, partial [Gaiellaceae bacterium]|nr:hypothetical protein [Gaiellaceae bacterium]